MTCPATTFDFGEVVRCELPEGHEGLHQGGCIGWRTPAVVENTVARERRIAYGVALEGLGVDFDPDASALTLLLQVQEETAKARELRAAIEGLVAAIVDPDAHTPERCCDCPTPTLATWRDRDWEARCDEHTDRSGHELSYAPAARALRQMLAIRTAAEQSRATMTLADAFEAINTVEP